MTRPIIFAIGFFASTLALGDTVTITSSASTIAQGGTDTFTASVSPGTYVQSVIFSYQGESGTDQVWSSPYSATHQFNTPQLNLTVTATVIYSNGDPDGTATTTINVIGLTLAGSATPLRAYPTTYSVTSNPTGITLSSVTFTYTSSSYVTTAQGSTSWSGLMVADGTMNVTATAMGVTPSASKSVTITKRTWTTAVTCVEDNDSSWGEVPDPAAELGENRDKDSDVSVYIFVPRSGDDFTPAMTYSQLTSGPCAGWWYVASSTLKCQRETVINKYIKSNGPALGGLTFQQANAIVPCFTGDFVTAVKHHEYRGTPPTARSWEGHQGRIEYEIQDVPGKDAKKHIESALARTLDDLKTSVNSSIWGDEYCVWTYASDESDLWMYGPNWGSDPGALGYGWHAAWLGSGWSGCDYGPSAF